MKPLFAHVDLSFVAVLAAVTLLEGIQRVPANALIARRSVGGSWRVWQARQFGPKYQLLSWWPPFYTSLVLPLPAAGTLTDEAAARARLDLAAPWLPDLRLLGGIALLALVFGVPAAIAQYGGFGFIVSVTFVFVLSIAIATMAFVAARPLATSRAAAARWAAHLLSPFAAPRAAEALLQQAACGMPPALVVQYLLPKNEFLAWLHPYAYDVSNEAATESDVLVSGLGSEVLRLALQWQKPMDGGATLRCARCGASFSRGSVCPDCAIDLIPHASNQGTEA